MTDSVGLGWFKAKETTETGSVRVNFRTPVWDAGLFKVFLPFWTMWYTDIKPWATAVILTLRRVDHRNTENTMYHLEIL